MYLQSAICVGLSNCWTTVLILIIQGQNLNLACGTTEAMVFIGMEMCKVNSMDAETIYCLPPVYQPNALDFAGRRTGQFPVVKVTTLFLFFNQNLVLLLSYKFDICYIFKEKHLIDWLIEWLKFDWLIDYCKGFEVCFHAKAIYNWHFYGLKV